MEYKQTLNCVRCGKPAIYHTGHVLKINWKKSEEQDRVIYDKIFAGWCSKKCENDPGFCGQYTENMGIDGDSE